MPPPPAGAGRGNWRVSPEMASDLARFARWTGRPLVAIGLILVMLSKGCDAINQHSVVRATALAQAAVEQFDEDIQFRKQAVQSEIKGITGRDDAVMLAGQHDKTDDLKGDERKKVEELRKELTEIDTQAVKDRKSKEAGDWHDLRIAARNAKRTFAVNSYWHELFFVFSAIVLLLGLLIVSWGAEGAERWISLVMLAIITYSLFVSGLAWIPVPG
jgi:hypothetical protein